jgi:hypothetical protein
VSVGLESADGAGILRRHYTQLVEDSCGFERMRELWVVGGAQLALDPVFPARPRRHGGDRIDGGRLRQVAGRAAYERPRHPSTAPVSLTGSANVASGWPPSRSMYRCLSSSATHPDGGWSSAGIGTRQPSPCSRAAARAAAAKPAGNRSKADSPSRGTASKPGCPGRGGHRQPHATPNHHPNRRARERKMRCVNVARAQRERQETLDPDVDRLPRRAKFQELPQVLR